MKTTGHDKSTANSDRNNSEVSTIQSRKTKKGGKSECAASDGDST